MSKNFVELEFLKVSAAIKFPASIINNRRSKNDKEKLALSIFFEIKVKL